MPDFIYDAFLSYSPNDQAAVRVLAERLRVDNVRVWFDEWMREEHSNTPNLAAYGMERSRILVLCHSNSYMRSGVEDMRLAMELTRAPNNERRLFFFSLDDSEARA